MKKATIIFILLTLFLSACSKEPPAETTYPSAAPTTAPATQPTESTITPSTVPTEAPTIAPTEAPTTAPTTQPTVPTTVPTEAPTTAPVETAVEYWPMEYIPQSLSQMDIKFFNAFLGSEWADGEEGNVNYYNRILNKDLRSPERVDLYALFNEQDSDESYTLTEAEKTFLNANGLSSEADIQRISKKKMDAVLSQLLGITLEQTNGIGLERMVYFPDTECYYHAKTHDGFLEMRVTGGTWKGTGLVEIYYDIGQFHVCVLTMRNTEDGYQIVSNMNPSNGASTPEQSTETQPVQILSPTLWQTEPEYLSSADYFSAEHSYSTNATSWIVMDGRDGIVYQINWEDLAVHSSASSNTYPIPNRDTLDSYNLIAADGKFLYMYNDQEMIKAEILTGQILDRVSLDTGIILNSKVIDNTVYYYMAKDEAQLNVYRIYLPELKVELMHSYEAPERFYSVVHSDDQGYTQHGLSYTVMNPDMLDFMLAELAKPDSEYYSNDYNDLWTAKNPFSEIYLDRMRYYFHVFQEASGEPALVCYTYDYAEENFDIKKGIICKCAFGSGADHDHFDPQEYDVGEPVVINSEWRTCPGLDIQGVVLGNKPEGAYSQGYGLSSVSGKLYLQKDGIYTAILDEVLSDCYNSFLDSGSSLYCITQDNRILQVAYDGSVCNTVYSSGRKLKGMAYMEDSLYIVEDETILEIDTTNMTCRELIHQDYLSGGIYFGGENKLVFAAIEGLSSRRYSYDTKTSAVEPWNWL